MAASTTTFQVIGRVDDPGVYAVLAALKEIKNQQPGAVEWKEADTVLEPEWDDYLRKQQLALGGACYGHKESPLVLKNGAYLGGIEAFKACVAEEFHYKEPIALEAHQFTAVEGLRKALKERKRLNCYMDIRVSEHGGLRRVIFELCPDLCPKAVENFRALCSGERGPALSYKGSPFHRVVPDGWVQGGDIVTGNGDGGQSIYGETYPDECFSLPLDKAGVLAMANKGSPHSNASQFFITLAPLPWLQYKVVGIGRLVKGLDVVRAMSTVKALNERPLQDVMIVNCGVVNLDDDSTTLLAGPSTILTSITK